MNKDLVLLFIKRHSCQKQVFIHELQINAFHLDTLKDFFKDTNRSKAYILKRVSLIRLLYSLNDGLVDSEGDGDAEQGEQQVRYDTDDTERG